jgi:hypothetical protein
MSVYSYEGGSLHGPLGIILMKDDCFVVATDVFPAAANPGGMATILVGVMAVQITESKLVTCRGHAYISHISRYVSGLQEANH